MNFRYDHEADALAIDVREDALVSRTEQIDPGTLVDLDQRGNVVAIEVLRPARSWPIDEIAGRFHLDPGDEQVLRDLWRGSYPFAEPALVA